MRSAILAACALACGGTLAAQTAGGSVAGQVVNAATGAPVRRARVTVRLTRGVPGSSTMVAPDFRAQSSAETDDEGMFQVGNLPAGGYAVLAERQGFLMPGQRQFTGDSGLLMVGESQQLTGVTVKLTPQAVISGKVLDENGDPVAGVNIAALRWGYTNGKRQLVNAGTTGFLQTNDLGEYRIAGLPAGKYFVTAGPPRPTASMYFEAPAAQDTSYTNLYYPSATDPGGATEVETKAGAETRGIDIRLRKVKSVTIRGRLMDPGAPPERSGSVSLTRREGSSFQYQIGFPFSMQGGEFRIVGVPPGSYTLVARRSGDRGAMEAGASLPIEVADRNIEGLSVQMSPAVDVEGVIVSEPPGRCPGALVFLMDESGFGGPGSSTSRDSKFTIRGLLPGTYRVNVPATGGCYVKSMRFGGRPATEQRVRVDGKGPLEITMAATDATVEGTVTDAAGKPVAALVSLVAKDGTQWGQRVTAASRAGAFSAFGMGPGTYDVYAWESVDYQAAQSAEYVKAFASRAKTVTVGTSGRHTVPTLVAIPAAETGEPVAAPPFTPAKASVEGTVVNAATGAAMAGVKVTLSTRRPARGLPGSITMPGGFELSADTDAQGRFVMREVEPDIYYLSAARPGFSAEGPANQPTLTGDAIVVGNGQKIVGRTIRLTPQSVLAGRVTDEFGEAVAGAQIAIHRTESTGVMQWLPRVTGTQTDDLGKFRMPGLPPGSYYVAASRRAMGRVARNAAPAPEGGAEMGYGIVWYPNAAEASGATPVTVGAGAEVPVEIVMRRTRVWRVRGTVVDENGSPVERPVVGLSPRGMVTAVAVGSVTPMPGGAFEIAGVPAGSYLLWARPAAGEGGPAQRQAFTTVEVRDGSVEVRAQLSVGREVRGTVRMEGGGTVAARVSLQSAEGYAAATSANGAFTLTRVWPLSYAVTVAGLCPTCSVKSVSFGGREMTGPVRFEGAGELEIVLSVK